MSGTRSKLMLLAVVLALGAYVPACCCWMESLAAWAMGSGSAGAHACCEHHHSGAAGEDGAAGDDDSGTDQGGGTPRHVAECGCGVQHRIGVQVEPTVLDFAPAVLAWVAMPLELGEAGVPGIAANGWDDAASADGGSRTLLRQHCALTI